jgi:PAS domain S-box-containing protein
MHGGTVSVESTAGTGSTFTVRVPLGTDHLPADQVVEQHADGHELPAHYADGFLAEAIRWADRNGEPSVTDGAPGAAPAPPAGPGPQPEREPGRGRRSLPLVLVVDDNADMREYVADLLSGRYAVETAVDGVDALQKARANPPDLVLTDVMMPNLDGFGLLAAIQKDPQTTGTPLIMLSARAGEEGTVEGLAAGADDYLIKPFSGRELLARVRSNLELDRTRRTRDALEHSQALLDHAQRLAHVGSWDIDLATGRMEASPEHLRITGRSQEDLDRLRYPDMVIRIVHPDDQERVREALRTGLAGSGLAYDARITMPDGTERLVSVIGEVVRGENGQPVRIRGSIQDITEQRRAEQALASVAAQREASMREHQIADELQRSLLPERAFAPDHLDVATYYRAGVEGTQVGGDWYDVIELGAGRTALVVGDVMGRGVQAAAVMGQLRSAVRAYARLDLPPADVLESLDGMVRDLGDDQIVTCVYAVFDPDDRTLTYANAGHLPPLLTADGQTRQLADGQAPPLGVAFGSPDESRVDMPPGSTVTLYTDGLVERRGRDIDLRIDALADELSKVRGRPGRRRGGADRVGHAVVPGPLGGAAAARRRGRGQQGSHVRRRGAAALGRRADGRERPDPDDERAGDERGPARSAAGRPAGAPRPGPRRSRG